MEGGWVGLGNATREKEKDEKQPGRRRGADGGYSGTSAPDETAAAERGISASRQERTPPKDDGPSHDDARKESARRTRTNRELDKLLLQCVYGGGLQAKTKKAVKTRESGLRERTNGQTVRLPAV